MFILLNQNMANKNKINPKEFVARLGEEKSYIRLTVLTILLMERCEITMDDLEKAIKKVRRVEGLNN